jgi:hypothetical protein
MFDVCRLISNQRLNRMQPFDLLSGVRLERGVLLNPVNPEEPSAAMSAASEPGIVASLVRRAMAAAICCSLQKAVIFVQVQQRMRART